MNMTTTPATITHVVLMLETASSRLGPAAAEASAGSAKSAPAQTPRPMAVLRNLLRMGAVPPNPPADTGPAVAVTERCPNYVSKVSESLDTGRKSRGPISPTGRVVERGRVRLD